MGKGGAGKGKGGYDANEGGGSHYFGADPEEEERRKQEMKLQKKLREIEGLEKRRDAGEKLEGLQLKKLENKAGILEELAKVAPKKKACIADDDDDDEVAEEEVDITPNVDLDDIRKELEFLEQEKRELEEMEKASVRAKASDKGKGKSSKGKGKEKPPSNAPPSVSMRASQAAASASASAAASRTGGGGKAWGGGGASAKPQGAQAWPMAKSGAAASESERRCWIPASTEEKLAQFRDDLQHWAAKFNCSWSIEGQEVVSWFTNSQQIDEAMSELEAIAKFDLGN